MRIEEIKGEFPEGATFEELPNRKCSEPRSSWPPGPWEKEPWDKVVWTDPLTGLDCMAIRGGMGAWCGYVGIPKGHPWYGVGYSECTKGHRTITQKQQIQKYRRARDPKNDPLRPSCGGARSQPRHRAQSDWRRGLLKALKG